MPSPHRGRHEFGQNFLGDASVVDAVIDLVDRTAGPIIEIGPGDGALTLPLQKLGRPLIGIEIDRRRAAALARRVNRSTTIVAADFLRYPLPRTPHVLVGNLPFHQTTAMLRRVLHVPGWTHAVLLVQWEVARRRAGVGGATMMTAQWWPWFEFGLVRRVPAAAFHPRPGVDGGLLTVARRDRPLVDDSEMPRYQDFVHRVFTGRGRNLAQIIPTACPEVPKSHVLAWLRSHQGRRPSLPKELTARQWASLFLVRTAALTGRGSHAR
ncbi:MAG: 23S ribosomal RNA methyltransferase Erm [Kutzneria sp.]|nr:23S ribosomal RNA methyltransferase Erm [Kutzneria sp.]